MSSFFRWTVSAVDTLSAPCSSPQPSLRSPASSMCSPCHLWLPTSSPCIPLPEDRPCLRENSWSHTGQKCQGVTAPRINPQSMKNRNFPVSLPFSGLIWSISSLSEGVQQDWTPVVHCSNLLTNTFLMTFLPSIFPFPHFPTPFPNKLLALKYLSQGVLLGELKPRKNLRKDHI